MCDRWRDSFEEIYKDMGPTYKEGLVLDRIDNDGIYCPENCRWTTYKENSRNKAGVYKDIDIAELSAATGVGKTTIYYRILHGWPLEMLTIKPDYRHKMNGKKTSYIRKYSTLQTADRGQDSLSSEQEDLS